jgi:hypothetical protein
MADHFHSSSSNAERGQVNQQIRSESHHYSAMGNISGGIMRFNLGIYSQPPNVDRIGVQQKKGSHSGPRNKHGGQVAPDVRSETISQISGQGSAKA